MKKLLGFSHSFKSTLPYNKFFFFINLLAEVLLEDAATQTFLLFRTFETKRKTRMGTFAQPDHTPPQSAWRQFLSSNDIPH